jgi:ABC-2 type transport system ATP-binding protein
LIQGLKDDGKTIFFSTHILSDAEALCDRVAVIHKGELRGIGAINEIRTSVAERSEVIWDGPHALSAVSSSLVESHVTGETVRGIVRIEDVDSLLEQLRRERARLISVTPLHGTLEEYFLARTAEQEKVIS